MRKFLTLSLAALLVVCFSAFAWAGAPADGAKMDKTKNPVVFNHSTHATVDCKECHHKAEDPTKAKKCSDAGCHDVFDKKDKTSKSYYFILHEKKKAKMSTCLSCHAEIAGKDKAKKKQLTGCKKSACHK